MKIKIGITGQDGFVGQHLYNNLGLFSDDFERVPFRKDFFQNEERLNLFITKCEVIIHLAAVNRHHEPKVIYETNIELVKKLISGLNQTKSKAHIIFASSTQEEGESPYGISKKEGRKAFAQWAIESGGKFSGLIIPNVFGPFGLPNYNSFISTFCHQLCNDELPIINQDNLVKLIYIDDLIKVFIDEVRSGKGTEMVNIDASDEFMVSSVLNKLKGYQSQYLVSGVIPEMKTSFELNLFNTFRSYINIKNHFPFRMIRHSDSRGGFVEVIREKQGGQVSFSTTLPGITRGNHFHTRKIERFAVIKGKAIIRLRKIGSDEIQVFYLNESEPAYVDIPIWHTHNISNIGDEELYTVFWISEFYDPCNPDTFIEQV